MGKKNSQISFIKNRMLRAWEKKREEEEDQESSKNAKIVAWISSGMISIKVYEIIRCWVLSLTLQHDSIQQIRVIWMKILKFLMKSCEVLVG